MQRNGPDGQKVQYSRQPLQPGDALVLKPLEVHRTDPGVLNASQWRLAIGFKVLPPPPRFSRLGPPETVRGAPEILLL